MTNYPPPPRTKILLAVTPDMRDRLERILARHDLTTVHASDAAMRANGFLDLSHFPDDEEGNTRIRRIVDYLILIDGDLQHIARTTGETLIPADRRRSAN